MILAAFLFMKRMAEVTNVTVITKEFDDSGNGDSDLKVQLPPGVLIYEINGPFFFGAAEKFTETIRQMSTVPDVLIVRMRHVTAIDATGIKTLEDILKKTSHQKTRLIISDIHSQPYLALERAGFLFRLGETNLFTNIEDAIGSTNNTA